MKNEKIVNAAKEHENRSGFGELANSEISRGVISAYGIGFLDGAEWALAQPQIIEIFGKRVKIINDDNSSSEICMVCALFEYCRSSEYSSCQTADGKFNRHFVLVDEDGNENGGRL